MKIRYMICLAFVLFSVTSCTRSFHNWNSKRIGDIEEMYKVQDADNRLYNYQWFFDQYNQIKSTANNAKLLDGEEKKGTLMVLNSMIAEYNSKASQQRNSAQWKSAELPRYIDLRDVYKE